jgi:hypothetical protein
MLLNDMHVRQVRADREREIAQRIRDRRHDVKSGSVRRAVGRSMISIGSRLAAEPQPRLARSR